MLPIEHSSLTTITTCNIFIAGQL